MCTDFIKEVTIHITQNDLTSLLWEELPNASGQRKAAVATTLCCLPIQHLPTQTSWCQSYPYIVQHSTAQYIRD